ncbi:MAG: GNAT family N-acetyltransferase [Sphaerochaetaceae bacterium]|nr:GNAT family N-acetyltransferase [Sphaerochaetaceae bacterium]
MRSLTPTDAPRAVNYMKAMYIDSPYLARYGDEWNISIDDEATFLENAARSQNKLMLGGFIDDELVALCDFSPLGLAYKMAHRCQIGISVAANQQGNGIGSLLMKTLLDAARLAGYEQMELEVVASNTRAVHLYNHFGFREMGRIPRGFHYREGYYEDLLLMVRELQ